MRSSPTSDVALGTGAVAVLGFVWAWMASGPSLMMGLNWDTASYMAAYASGEGSWRDLPWNSHFGLGPLYHVGYLLARLWGGTRIDGARLVGAAAFSAAVAIVACLVQRLCGRLGLLWAALYAGSWGMGLLLLTVEDNVLYLPVATALLALSLVHIYDWHWRHSVFAGVLGAAGILVSWQAGLYLFAPLYVTLAQGGAQRGPATRVRDAMLVLATLLVALHAYLLTFWLAAEGAALPVLWRTLFSRPKPSFFPESWPHLVSLLSHPRQVFRHVGLGVIGGLGPNAAGARWVQDSLPTFGLLALLLTAALTLWATQRARTTGRWHMQALLTVALALLAATALYVDLPADKYKRYEFLPLMVALIGAAACEDFMLSPPMRRGLTILLGVAALLQFVLVVTRAHQHRARIPEREPPGYHGKDGLPWFVYFRALRRAHPDACRFTLPLDGALAHGRYQLEIPAALWSELPDHLIVGDPDEIALWPRKVKMLGPQALPPPTPCEWRSESLRGGGP